MDDIKPPKKPALPDLKPYSPAVFSPQDDSEEKSNQVASAIPLTSEIPIDKPDPDEQATANPAPDLDLHISPSHAPKSRKKKIILIAATGLAIVFVAAVVAWFFFIKPKPQGPQLTQTPTPTVTKPVEKPKYYSPLTGTEVADEATTKRPVTGVMIENSVESRPQSGLTDAGIIFEAIAEGGITRFLALYQEAQPSSIGPIRSARPYYIDFNLGFDASFAHVGGSPQAMQDIKSLGVKDLDQFYNGNSYERISSRYAPHNVYTSIAKLEALSKEKGYTSSKFTPLARKVDVAQTPVANTIDFSISGPTYSPRFTYDPATNSYRRLQAGEAHVDDKGQQISPKVVAALIMNKSIDSDGSHTLYTTTGSGKLYIFQDGIMSEGTWSKADRKSSFVFTDKNGLPMKLNRGQLWVSILGNTADVQYKL